MFSISGSEERKEECAAIPNDLYTPRDQRRLRKTVEAKQTYSEKRARQTQQFNQFTSNINYFIFFLLVLIPEKLRGLIV